ncbi:MAG: hypothetical protein P1V51_16875 [Deltaproteobacteria bacterium]|nr:hypothetical protein [Deltaproteobacteria bacterium]
MRAASSLSIGGLLLFAGFALARPPEARAADPADPADPHAPTPSEAIAAAKAGGPARLVPGGEAVDGVKRDEVRVVRPGEEIDEGDLVVDERGRATLAVVRRRGEGEEIIVLRTRTPEGKFAPTEVVSPKATKGQRAWHPRLATGPEGAVWLTWCGIAKAERGKHRREVYLRRIAPNRARPRITVSTGLEASDDRHCDPVIAVDGEGGPVVAWEAGERIAWRRYDEQGKARGPASFASAGPLDRRPSLLVRGDEVLLAWDRWVDHRDLRSRDPTYEIWLRRGEAAPEQLLADPGIEAAPHLFAGPGGEAWMVFHQTVPPGLVKTTRLVALGPEGPTTLAGEDALGGVVNEGESQGAEFPAAVTLPSGRVVAVSRPSQGAFLHRFDEGGRRPILDLTRRGWGARGRRMAIAAAPDGSVLILRRARHEVVLERLLVPPGGAPKLETGLARSPRSAWPYTRPTASPPAWQPGPVLFGDVHMHSAISDGTGAPDEVLARAHTRGLDFAVLTDHDYVVGSQMALSEHDEISWLTDVFDRLPQFAALHGYEWTTPPVPTGFGHRNVYFRGAPPETVFGSKGVAPTTADLNAKLAKEKAFTAPHHTAWTGTDWEGYQPEIQRHFEVVSAHGAFEGKDTSPIAPRGELEGFFALDGLKAGHVFGFLGGSDGHGLLWHHGIARRADSWALGLTGVRLGVEADPEDRGALWDGLFARRTVATSGVRMEAYLQVGGLAPGEVGTVPASAPVRIALRARRAPVLLQLVRDGQVVWETTTSTPTFDLDWKDEGLAPGKHFHYLRAIVGQSAGEAEVVWTSPIFSTVE